MRALAVRLDIRPRIVLRDDAPPPRRRGLRLPPIALPAAGYWLLMGALTYFFAQLGPHPLDSIEPARAAEPEVAELAPPTTLPPPPTPALAPQPANSAVGSEVEEAEPTVDNIPRPDARLEISELERARARARENEAPDQPRRSDRSTSRSDEASAPAEQPRVALAFPEFTDSSRPPARERAADGPRLDSLFERAEAPSKPAEAPPAPARIEEAPSRPVLSCEAAIARNSEQLEIGGPRGPVDVTREAYASILQNGSFLAGCRIPDRTVFEICAAVKDGHAVGVTVVSSPASASLNACVRSAVSRLKFPSSPRLDVTHTRFDAARR